MRHPRRLNLVVPSLLLLLGSVACGEGPTAPAADALAPRFASQNVSGKFTFESVVLPDGTEGIIEAAAKSNANKGTFTKCSYFTAGYGAFLGGFGDDSLAAADAADAAAVLAYCLEHYDDRQ